MMIDINRQGYSLWLSFMRAVRDNKDAPDDPYEWLRTISTVYNMQISDGEKWKLMGAVLTVWSNTVNRIPEPGQSPWVIPDWIFKEMALTEAHLHEHYGERW
jgi:hypothetical protein